MNMNEIRIDQFPGKCGLLIICNFKKIKLIPATVRTPFSTFHTTNTAAFFRVSRKSDRRHPVHTVMPLHTHACSEREV